MRIRRSAMDICAEILDIISKGEKGITKTHIMYRANISFRQLQNYLSLLLKLDLLKEVKEEKRVTYEITQKGKLFLESYRTAKELVATTERQEKIGIRK